MSLRLLVVLLMAGTLAACGGGAAEPLPPAQPLRADAAALARIPGMAAGVHEVETLALDLRLHRELSLRAVLPRGPGPWPLVLFSHGFASAPDQYDALARHWASHGYAVIAPAHRDTGGTVRAIFASLRHGNEGLVRTRVEDFAALLDALARGDDPALGPVAARLDLARIAAAGHSFGAFTAQQLGGAAAVDPQTGEPRVAGFDPRVRAVVAVSPPGPMFDLINERSWRSLRVPQLATTGTHDVDGRFFKRWEDHRLSFDTAPAGANWLLVVEGADHYLGNLICRTQRDAAPQADALRMVNAGSVAFLDAMLKGAPDARDFLDTRPLADLTGGFARLEHR